MDEHILQRDKDFEAAVNTINERKIRKSKDHECAIIAAGYGDNHILEPLLRKKDIGINVPNHYGNTMLSAAATNGRLSTIRLLLDYGADVNIVCKHGGKAIHFASLGGYAEIIRILVEAGADVNAMTNKGNTPLMLGAKNSSSVVSTLIELGADPNLPNVNLYGTKNRNSALFNASRYGSVESVRILIDAGAEINLVNVDGMTPLSGAIWACNIESAELLIQAGADISPSDPKINVTPLIGAIFNGNEQMVVRLLDLGADPNENEKNAGADVPLTQAIDMGDLTLVKILIGRGANVNYRDNAKAGRTPLIHAIMSDCKQCIPALIRGGADPNITDVSGHSPAMAASYRGYIAVLKKLYRCGADLNARSQRGETALDILNRVHPNKYESFIAFLKKDQLKKMLKQENLIRRSQTCSEPDFDI